AYCVPRDVHRFPTRRSSDLMAEQGLYRWGNQYVTREERERIEAQQKEIQGQLDVLARRFDELEGRIREIDVQGEQNDRTLRQLRSEEHTSELQSRENIVCRL